MKMDYQQLHQIQHVPQNQTLLAIEEGDKEQEAFHRQLKEAGQAVIEQVKKEGKYAIVLAARPYQNDALVNHDLPDMFVKLGIPVLTADSIPEINDVYLKNSRLDVVNNYHARMLSSAILAAEKQYLEYVQLVSFGCGHDAYLSDEIIRMMDEISGKVPLILKVDESDIQGTLGIRVRSFVETINMRRKIGKTQEIHELTDPYLVKYTKKDRKQKTVLAPNTSHAFSQILSAVLCTQNVKAVPLEIGRKC